MIQYAMSRCYKGGTGGCVIGVFNICIYRIHFYPAEETWHAFVLTYLCQHLR